MKGSQAEAIGHRSIRDRSELAEFFTQLRLHVWWFLLTVAAAMALAAGLTKLQPTQFKASASLFFRSNPLQRQNLFGSNTNTGVTPFTTDDRQAANNLELVSLPVIAERTASRLGPGFSSDNVQRHIKIAPRGDSDVIEVTATYPDASLAARVATRFAEEYIGFRTEADKAQLKDARELINRLLARLSPKERRLARGRTLERRAEDLALATSLQSGNAELVQPAMVPEHRSSPQPIRNMMIAFVTGILFGLMVVGILGRLDRKLRTPKEIEEIYDRPVLTLIPNSRRLARGRFKPELPPKEAEAFQLLRANMQYLGGGMATGLGVIMVTSAESGDGKSTTALHLAVAAAQAGTRTLLIDADIRRPAIGKRAEVVSGKSFIELMRSSGDLAECVGHLNVQPAEGTANGNGAHPHARLDLVTSEPAASVPQDVFGPGGPRALVAAAREFYEVVVIDVAPLTVAADAIPLVSLVDGIVVVSRLDKTGRASSRRLRDQIIQLDGNLIGTVVNAVSTGAGEGYGYTYGYYSAAPGRNRLIRT